MLVLNLIHMRCLFTVWNSTGMQIPERIQASCGPGRLWNGASVTYE